MIVCLYGKTCAAFVEPVVYDLRAAAATLNAEVVGVTIERALAERARDRTKWVGVRRAYVLPFDVPASRPLDAPSAPSELLRWLFPGAEVLNAFDVHAICWDKPTLAERWLHRSVRVPDGILTNSVDEAAAFVQQHEHAILKAPHSCGGHDHYVVTAAADGLVAEARGQAYELELVAAGARAHIHDRQLRYPGPFYLQKLVADKGARGVLRPAQLLRAYIVDGQLVCWTERYRPRVRRSSDWIISSGTGGKYRFVFSVNEEAHKLALRAAEVIGLRVGVVDVARTSNDGAYVLSAYTDGHHMMIDREFKRLPEFRDHFDFDRYIAEALVAEPTPVAPPPTNTESESNNRRRR
ncbi:MAG TPA: hypothetical protein VL403_18030 [Candidatus Kryptonia bacterium]|nr:hypothetical protein [Candidatus Kryptonia bacterium]